MKHSLSLFLFAILLFYSTVPAKAKSFVPDLQSLKTKSVMSPIREQSRQVTMNPVMKLSFADPPFLDVDSFKAMAHASGMIFETRFPNAFGKNDRRNQALPFDGYSIDPQKTIAAGSSHTFALTSSCGIKCWEGNTSDQLGADSNFRPSDTKNIIGWIL